jgi:ADP-ribose pyrophosphatase YjhB (NUDIX family)
LSPTPLPPGPQAAGRWTLPGGGLDHGEAPREGLRREVHEETGLQAEPSQVLDVTAQRNPPELTASGDDVHTVRVLYAAEVRESTTPRVVEVGGSTDAARWVAADELDRLPLLDLAGLGARLAGLRGPG